MPPRVLIVGAALAPELADLVAAARSRWQAAQVDSLHETADRLDAEPGFSLIVLLQSRPGQFLASDVLALQLAAPLARWLVLLGPWSEGEMQTGSPLPGVARIYWRQRQRLLSLLDRIHSGLRTELSLPPTATMAERIGQAASDPPARLAVDLIGVVTREKTTFDALADVCRSGGCSSIWLLPQQPPPKLRTVAAYLWDFTHGDPLELQQAPVFARLATPAPIVGLLGFPRQQDIAAMADLGIVAVVGKPYLINELLDALHAATQSNNTQSRVA